MLFPFYYAIIKRVRVNVYFERIMLMKTIRELIEKFMYEQLEYCVSMVDKDGGDTLFRGIRVMDGPAEQFVYGALVNASVSLYLYYVKNGDERAEKMLSAVKKFTKSACSAQIKTWGKLSVLRAMANLYKAGKLDIIPADDIEILKEKTNYEDFFEKSEMKLIEVSTTNYMRVAMACAGFREMMGWDTEPFCDKIRDKLIFIMTNGSDNGYMDEDPPMARFDRYSIIVTSELSDTMEAMEREVPQPVLDNLAHAAKMSVQMANEKGDGINYGRSLSCFGDAATLEILASAFARGLIADEDRDQAHLYCIRITEKIFDFWYDKELRSFNIWWNGRSTNRYREERRVLEVNMDMAIHMLTTLHNFEIAGLADTLPNIERLPYPEKWVATPFTFRKDTEQSAEAIILRRKDTMVMLPLVGLGKMYMNAAYQPYPNICGVIEAAPDAKYPFLVPQYKTEDGALYRPTQFYTDIKTESRCGGVKVTAKGKLAMLGEVYPKKSEYGFETTFFFSGDTISAEFVTDLEGAEAEMLVGFHEEGFTFKATGFDGNREETVDGVYNFLTPAGPIVKAVTYTAKKAGKLSYKITLNADI